MAPHAMVMKRHGNTGFVVVKALVPSHAGFSLRSLWAMSLHNSGISGIFQNRPTRRAKAMKSSEKAKSGYILPMILSMGNIVAMT